MNQHLSTEQIDRLMAGDAPAADKRHVEECADCSAQLARARETLSSFGQAVKRCAEHHRGAEVPSGVFVQARQRSVTNRRLRWAMGTAAVIGVAAIPVFKGIAYRQREVQSREDSLLLEQVNQHVSRVVPESMEPFMDFLLVTDETETGGRE